MQWADVFGIIVAFVAVIVTVLSVILGFLFTNNYGKHVRELQEVRSEYASIARELEKAHEANAGALRESLLAVKSMFDYMMAHAREHSLALAQDELRTRNVWKGRPVTEEQAGKYAKRLESELESVRRDIAARRTELYWLVGEHYEWSAHLHALVETHGDVRTISLLESLRQSNFCSRDRDELLVATARLRQRLGKPMAAKINSKAWTG
jgi:uncharacterized membrane-anchored protein YhcB (DUF1043 family)